MIILKNDVFIPETFFVLGKDLRATTTKTGRYYDPEGDPVEGRSVRTKLGSEKPMGE